MIRLSPAALALLLLPLLACSPQTTPTVAQGDDSLGATSSQNGADPTMSSTDGETAKPAPDKLETASLGAGCFWCVEAVLEQIDGVHDVRSGYMGGRIKDPSYEQVCSGTTGHAEIVQVDFDPDVIPYAHVLEYFWKLHDPTTLNRQGADVGTQYRSVIFYHSPEQKTVAEESKKTADASGAFDSPIVTEISEASVFYVADNYHQDYYRLNKSQPYCRIVIAPKLDKLGLDP